MEDKLREIGLDSKESKLYLACLKNEQNSPASLVRQTGFKRTTVYFYLDRLQQKGLITEKVKGRRKTITAISPEISLMDLQSTVEEKVSQQKKALQNLIPQLKKMVQERIETTQFHLYEGKAGVHPISDILIKEKKDNYWFGAVENFTDIIDNDIIYRNFTLPRMKQRTTGYAITDRRVLKNKRASETLGNFRQFRFLDEIFSLPAGYIICGDYTIIGVKHDKQVKFILIKDSLVAELMRTVFMLLWDRMPKS